MTTPRFPADLLEKLSKLLADRAVESWLSEGAVADSAPSTAERTDAPNAIEAAGSGPVPARSLSAHQASETKSGQP